MGVESFLGDWNTPLGGVALGSALVALLGLTGSIAAARRRRFRITLVCGLGAVVFLSLAGSMAAVTIGIRGFENLTHETTAARVLVRPIGRQVFEAQFRFPDGRMETYVLRGDELYVDAHILKWKSVANWFGLHTQYELDRVAGRYRVLEDEQRAQRTVYGLSRPRSIDLFQIVSRSARFSPLVDAEYGSATFVLAERSATFEIRVSTSGLLAREVSAAGAPTEGSVTRGQDSES
jgi:hypothetical protein